jgi:hypothetical protein
MVLSGLAITAGIVYGLLAKELAGAVLLGVFAVALLYIATVLEHAGPYDFAENDPEAEAEVGPSHLFPPSWWPLGLAAGAALFIIGLKFNIYVLGVGVVVAFVSIIGWFAQAGRYAAEKAAHAAHESNGHVPIVPSSVEPEPPDTTAHPAPPADAEAAPAAAESSSSDAGS